MKKEFLVGLFIFIGLCIIGMSVFLIKDIKLKKGYKLILYFDDVGNLMERAWVRMHGVKIGRVEKIFVKEDKACVVVWIDAEVKLYKNAKAKISSTGVLGVKYVEFVQPEEKTELLHDGDEIFNTESVVSIDEALSSGMDSVKKFADFLSSISGKDLDKKFNKIVSNIENLTAEVNKAISAEQLKNTIETVRTAGDSINNFFATTKDDINTAVLTLKDVSKKLDEVVSNIKSTETVIGQVVFDKDTGKKVAETISSIKSVADKADKTLNRINLFTTYWDCNFRYDIKSSVSKNDIGKFYYLKINNLSTEEEYSGVEKCNTLSLGIGGTFYDRLTLYGGLIRSYGGIGVKFLPLGYNSKLLELGFEVYNLSSKGVTPQVDFDLKLKLLRWLYLGGRYENILNSQVLNTSLNVRFEDEDIAYLLGLIGLTR